MNIPKRFEDAIIDDSIRLESNESWYLWGESGVGKTGYIWALLIRREARVQAIRKEQGNESIIFPAVSFMNWVSLCKQIQYAEFEERPKLINRYKKVHTLFIDDLGAEAKTEFTNSVLYEILDYRCDHEMYTGITSNLSIGKLGGETFKDGYDGRTLSRLLGIVKKNIFEYKGEDRRWVK